MKFGQTLLHGDISYEMLKQYVNEPSSLFLSKLCEELSKLHNAAEPNSWEATSPLHKALMLQHWG